MTGTKAWTGRMLFVFLIGKSADVYGYDPLFVALAALDLVGAAVLWGLLRGGGWPFELEFHRASLPKWMLRLTG